MKKFKTYNQSSPYSSPWTIGERFLMIIWTITWNFFCVWTPKPLNKWRLLWLRIFGAKIYGKPFVHQSANINIPWNIILHDRACLGEKSQIYSLGEIEIFEDATVAQEVYLCTGTHDFKSKNRELQTGKIIINRSAFIGARSFIMPGVKIGKFSIVGACSVVTKDVDPYFVVAGNPASPIKKLQ